MHVLLAEMDLGQAGTTATLTPFDIKLLLLSPSAMGVNFTGMRSFWKYKIQLTGNYKPQL